MRIEAQKLADTSELGYSFSDQIDPRTRIRIGVVPLEIIRKKGLLNQLPENSIYHDVGGGVGASALEMIDIIPADIRSTLTVFISEPFNDIPTGVQDQVKSQVDRLILLKSDANKAAEVVTGARLVSLINMVHLLCKEDRQRLIKSLYDGMPDWAYLVVSTTFIENWIPSEEFERINAFHKSWRLAVVREAKRVLSQDEFGRFKQNWHENRLELLNEGELIGDFTTRPNPFKVVHKSIEVMPCDVESYDRIRHDLEWLQRTFRGIDPNLASRIEGGALQKVLAEKEGSVTMKTPLPRNTLVVVLQKRRPLL